MPFEGQTRFVKIGLLDERILPNLFEQFVLGQDAARVFNQTDQKFDRFRRQRNEFAAGPRNDAAALCVETEIFN